MTRRTAVVEPATSIEHTEPYHIRYRPKELRDVVGQGDVVRSLEAAYKAKARQHTYFFIGPGGTGKTTLARIMASMFGCEGPAVIEVDAASNSGIDEMKAVLEGLRYNGFGASPNKAYIIDECHRLSANAWDALLKSTEEPPPHVFFFFCSTNPTKIPKAMLTRGPTYVLNPVRFDPLMDLLEYVAKQENSDAPDWALEIAARSSDGSPRQALVNFAMIEHAKDEAEADALLQGVGESPEVIELCRALIKDELNWSDVQRWLEPLKDLGAEGVRIQITLYLSAVLMSKTVRNVGNLLQVLDAFSTPCNPTDKLAPLLLAFGKFARY